MALWLLLAGFAGGVLAQIPHPYLVVLAGGALLVPRRASALTASGVLLVGLGLGSLTAAARSPDETVAAKLASEVARCHVSGSILEHVGDGASLIGVRRATCTGRPPIDDLGPLSLPRLDEDAGTLVEADGWIYPLEENGFEAHLTRSGALAGFHSTETVTGTIPSPALAVAARVKGGLRDAVSVLAPREGALLLGLTIGDTSRIDPVTEEHLRRAGLTHLVAVSGHTVAYTDGFRGLVRASIGVFVPFAPPTSKSRPDMGGSRRRTSPPGSWESVGTPLMEFPLEPLMCPRQSGQGGLRLRVRPGTRGFG